MIFWAGSFSADGPAFTSVPHSDPRGISATPQESLISYFAQGVKPIWSAKNTVEGLQIKRAGRPDVTLPAAFARSGPRITYTAKTATLTLDEKPCSDGSPDLGRAFLRTMMWGALAVPAFLGFLPALFARDRRGLHDRFAGTRVVRASA